MPSGGKNKISMTGKKYGRLLVIKQDGEDRWRQAMWLCKCDCGNMCTVVGYDLRHGRQSSCGCLRNETTIKRCTTHGCGSFKRGLSNEYKTWMGMRQRCYYHKHKAYKDYGGRGITICERWKNSFTNFYNDMGNRPVGHSIDRIDVNGNYEPSNCRWATARVQRNNQRNCKN